MATAISCKTIYLRLTRQMLRCGADQPAMLTCHRQHLAKPPAITHCPHCHVQHARPFASRTYYATTVLTYRAQPIIQGLHRCDAKQHARGIHFTCTTHDRCCVAMPTNIPCSLAIVTISQNRRQSHAARIVMYIMIGRLHREHITTTTVRHTRQNLLDRG